MIRRGSLTSRWLHILLSWKEAGTLLHDVDSPDVRAATAEIQPNC